MMISVSMCVIHQAVFWRIHVGQVFTSPDTPPSPTAWCHRHLQLRALCQEFEAAMAWKIPDLSHLPRLGAQGTLNDLKIFELLKELKGSRIRSIRGF